MKSLVRDLLQVFRDTPQRELRLLLAVYLGAAVPVILLVIFGTIGATVIGSLLLIFLGVILCTVSAEVLHQRRVSRGKSSMSCLCSVTLSQSIKNWNRDCPDHGINSDWFLETKEAAALRETARANPGNTRPLEEAQHNYQVRHGTLPELEMIRKSCEANPDPRILQLLDAVNAVLNLHARQDRPVRVYTMDGKCPVHALPYSLPASSGCTECQYEEMYVCSHCQCPNDAWPCPTYQAIVKALRDVH